MLRKASQIGSPSCRVAVFGTKTYDRQSLARDNARFSHDLTWFEPRLDTATAALAEGFPAVCVFVNDCLDAAVLACDPQPDSALVEAGIAYVAIAELLARADIVTLHCLADFATGRQLAHALGEDCIVPEGSAV